MLKEQQNNLGESTVEALWVPIVMFTGLTVIISLFFWFRFRARKEMQQTIRSAIDKGQELTPELVESLGSSQKREENKDLRSGLIWLAIGAGIALFGVAMGQIEDEVFPIMTGISALPFMIGVAYMVMWRVTERGK
jgi:hypothetical protein